MIRKNVDKMSALHSNLFNMGLYDIQNFNNFIYIHGCNSAIKTRLQNSVFSSN